MKKPAGAGVSGLGLAALLALGSACSSYCGDGAKGTPEPEDAAPRRDARVPSLARSPLRTPPAAPEPARTVGAGPTIAYPERVPLRLAPGLEASNPPMAVRALLPIPERRLAAVSGQTGAGLAVELIDVENATITWRETESCSGPIVHTTTDRIVCAGWKGTVALDVNSGRVSWTSPSIFRAAGAGYVVLSDATQVTVGELRDIATGRVITRVQMPEGYDLEEVHYLCADASGFDLYSYSAAGEVRRFRLGRREEIAALAWLRRLRIEPTRMDPCDPVILVETPIAGRDERHLRALGNKKGIPLGNRIEVRGWWRANTPGDIAVSTKGALEVRDRRLGNVRTRIDRWIGDERVAAWAGVDMIRSVGGTSLLITDKGVSHWLAAPVDAAQVVLTPDHLVAGPWRGRERSSAENLVLYKLPKGLVRSLEATPTPPPPPPPLTSESLEKMAKSDTDATKVVQFPHPGSFLVAQVALAGAALYIATDERPPRPGRGAGITVFDLEARAFSWYQEKACAAGSEVVGMAITDEVIVCAAREPYPGPGVLAALNKETGARLWSLSLETVDGVLGAGHMVVALVGSRAVVIDARRGEVTYEFNSDNGHTPRVALTGGRIIAVEPGGVVVARQPDGAPVWSVAVRGYIRELRTLTGAVAVHTNNDELFVIRAESGDVREIDGLSRQWKASSGGDLAFDSARGRQGELILWAYDARGQERFRTSYPTIIEWDPAPLRSSDPKAPVVLVSRQPEPRILQLDPTDGAVTSRHMAPTSTYRAGVFSTRVDGKGVAGLVSSDPMAVHIY